MTENVRKKNANLNHEELKSFVQAHVQAKDAFSFSELALEQHIEGLERILSEVDIPEGMDQETWLHYVAAPRVNNEALTPWMLPFQDWLWDKVKDLDMPEKILEVNILCGDEVTYRSSNARTLPPLALKKGIYGRCGEESTFVTAALRSVGIPARQVYVPLWNHSDDNHAWVEAYDGQSWRWIGACEPEAILDYGWFNAAAARAPLVVSRTHLPWKSKVTRDLGIDRLGFSLRNEGPRYREGAELSFQGAEGQGQLAVYLLNYSNLLSILSVDIPALESYRLNLGLGTYVIDFLQDGKHFSVSVQVDTAQKIEIKLSEKNWQEILEDLPQQWIAAPASSRNAIPGAPMKKGAEIKKRNSEHRQAKEEAQKEHAKALAEGRSDLELEILLRARGNASEVAKLLDLLEGDEAALYLLQHIHQKDLYELEAKAYYAELEPLLHQASDLPVADKAMYLLNPRVGVEIWSPYRVTKKDQEDIKPKDLLAKMEQRYQPGSVVSLGSQMPLLVLADQAKLSIYDFTKLFVAELRRHGYPAKLIEAGIVEFYDAGEWEQVSVIQKTIATLYLTSEEEANWTLGQNYSIMKIENRPSPIAAHIKAWTESSPEIVLTPGNYLLITRTRLSNGDQLSAQQCFSLKEGESLDLRVELPKVSADEMLLDLKLDEPNLLKALALPKEGIGLAVFAQGGHEPTEHTLEELAMVWDGLQKLDHLTIYHDVGQGKQDLLQSSRFKNLQEKGEVEIQALDFATYFEALGRHLFVEAGTLPLIFLYERVEGEVIVRMSTAGYQVGLGEQILQVLDHLK